MLINFEIELLINQSPNKILFAHLTNEDHIFDIIFLIEKNKIIIMAKLILLKQKKTISKLIKI